MPRPIAAAFVLLLSASALASGELVGKFSYDANAVSRCRKVDKKLAAKLEKLTCQSGSRDDTWGGDCKPPELICKGKDESQASYYVYATLADCKVARETEAANGD